MANSNKAFGVIDIKVRIVAFQKHNFRISNQSRVRNLKEDIARLIGIPMEQQHLIYSGRLLRDDQVISSCNVQHGDTLHLVRTIPGMSSAGSSSSRLGSHSTGTDGISPSAYRQGERMHARLILLQYLRRMRGEYNVNENNMNDVLRSVFNPSAPSQGIPAVEQLARLLSSTRDIFINQTSQLFRDLEGDLRQNLSVDDPELRQLTMLTMQTMFRLVGQHFLELGRVMQQHQQSENEPANEDARTSRQ